MPDPKLNSLLNEPLFEILDTSFKLDKKYRMYKNTIIGGEISNRVTSCEFYQDVLEPQINNMLMHYKTITKSDSTRVNKRTYNSRSAMLQTEVIEGKQHIETKMEKGKMVSSSGLAAMKSKSKIAEEKVPKSSKLQLISFL